MRACPTQKYTYPEVVTLFIESVYKSQEDHNHTAAQLTAIMLSMDDRKWLCSLLAGGDGDPAVADSHKRFISSITAALSELSLAHGGCDLKNMDPSHISECKLTDGGAALFSMVAAAIRAAQAKEGQVASETETDTKTLRSPCITVTHADGTVVTTNARRVVSTAAAIRTKQAKAGQAAPETETDTKTPEKESATTKTLALQNAKRRTLRQLAEPLQVVVSTPELSYCPDSHALHGNNVMEYIVQKCETVRFFTRSQLTLNLYLASSTVENYFLVFCSLGYAAD